MQNAFIEKLKSSASAIPGIAARFLQSIDFKEAAKQEARRIIEEAQKVPVFFSRADAISYLQERKDRRTPRIAKKTFRGRHIARVVNVENDTAEVLHATRGWKKVRIDG